jgi:hypothetical protein
LTRSRKPAAAVERETLAQLEFLFAKPLRKVDVLDCLQNPRTILRPQARQLALSLVDRYREETDPEKYHQASWAIIRQPYLNTFQYDFALQQVRAASQLAPEQAKYRTTLVVAQYRAGDCEKALKTLTETVALNHGHLVDLAFLAARQNHLGQKDQTQITLTRLREAMYKPEWAKDEEASHFLREAEAPIEGKAPVPKK